MTISVAIPAFNAAPTIRATLDSVLQQTVQPDEIVVLDDGSTDETGLILNSYRPRVTVVQGKHEGVSSARNLLCRHAQGELVAFLDSDDVWHPKYLEVQRNLSTTFPRAVATFCGHINFVGSKNGYEWSSQDDQLRSQAREIPSLEFFRLYNETTGLFASMSYCCVKKWALEKVGMEPFKMNGAEDSYLMYELALLGSVAFDPTPLVAYRIVEGSMSHNRLRAFGAWVAAFELLDRPYQKRGDKKLLKEFELAFASRRRSYAKLLMGAGKISEARGQLWRSLSNSYNPMSSAKSLGMLLFSYMPKSLQPAWPPSHREWKASENSTERTARKMTDATVKLEGQ